MKDALQRVAPPNEDVARERAWQVVAAAYAEREPVPRPSRRPWVALAGAAVAVTVLALASPPGQAVIDRVREVVGVEHAQPALFSLPSPGRVLVASDTGVWVVESDGKKRLLGSYREASWSPFGRFVVTARRNELAALEPDGDVRWTLARAGVRSLAWTGSATDTRIAYMDNSGLRIVDGDGTGDRLLVPAARGPLAWRPGPSRQLAYVVGGNVSVKDAETGDPSWSRPVRDVRRLEWSRDGELLLVQGERSLRLFDAAGRLRFELLRPPAAPVVTATFAPSGHAVAFVQNAGGRSDLWLVARLRPDASRARRLFVGAGRFTNLAWSPDGRWLLVTWPTADQWVFVSAGARSRIRAVANVSAQFRSRSFPRVEGWCCAR